MNRFYRVSVEKRPVGSAVELREPAMRGTIKLTVMDNGSQGDYKLFVIDAGGDEHRANLAFPGVEELSLEDAQKLALEYQPERTFTRFNPLTRKEEEVEIPAVDLKQFIGKD